MPAPTATTATAVASPVTASELPPFFAVLDNGAANLRLAVGSTLGSGSTSVPISTEPNFVARARSGRSGGSSRVTYVGSAIETQCTDHGGLHLRAPLERGFVIDWAAQKAVWDRALAAHPHIAAQSSQRGGRLLEGRTVIVTEMYFNLPDMEEALDTMLFEEYGAAAVWRCTAAQLVPYANIFSSESSSSAPAAQEAPSRASSLRGSGRSRGKRRSTIPARSTSQGEARRPECMLVLDLGHSACHAVPVLSGSVPWEAVRRLSLGGKLLSNLLKETLSFRQWDMMDETWLMRYVKEACCFVGAASGRRISGTIDVQQLLRKRPSDWTVAELVELSRLRPRKNPLLQEYVLPDYSYDSTTRRDATRRYGYIRSGPGSDAAHAGATQGSARAGLEKEADTSSSLLPDAPEPPSTEGTLDTEDELAELDAFIAAIPSEDRVPSRTAVEAREQSGGESDDDESEGEEYRASADEGEGDGTRKKSKAKAANAKKRKATAANAEDEQVLTLNTERFQVPEVLFAPSLIGLMQAPLPDLVASAIAACPAEMRGMLWGNIVLVGGTSLMPGLKRRLEAQLRELAPTEFDVRIWAPDDPQTVPTRGALALLTAPPTSALGRALRARITTRADWDVSGSAGSVAASRARGGTWSGAATRVLLEAGTSLQALQHHGQYGPQKAGAPHVGAATQGQAEGEYYDADIYEPDEVLRKDDGTAARARRAEERRGLR